MTSAAATPGGSAQAINSPGFEVNSSAWVRSEFIRYFESKGHVFWKSSPVLPHNDPTLLFANAGMNQFKDIITGKADTSTDYGRLKRVCNSQKCIRAGGKHNDLDDVGRDSYHHTFFEMLGNWSFGDYFKKEAIDYAWELLTEVYKLDKSRLYVTYFGGDPKLPACSADEEARELWLRHLPAERILPFGMKDNFWEMADTGPCGPCSEIHYDHIGNRDAASLVNADDPMVVELWNLVFMQYNRRSDGSVELLPKACVDTGMGLERVAAVLKASNSNYAGDLFTDIFAYINKMMPQLAPYGGSDSIVDVAYRVVADHARCLTVAIADGVEPSNDGRGYVLRRILRRAVRYGREHLGATGPFLSKLVDCVVASLGFAFPEIQNQNDKIAETIHNEEVLFLETLDKGCDRFKKTVAKLQAASSGSAPLVVSGADAFLLYSSFGFPLDLTQLMAREMGLEVDVDGFNEHFKRHQLLSEKKQVRSDDPVEQGLADVLASLSADVLATISTSIGDRATDDSLKYHGIENGYSADLEYDVEVLAVWSMSGLNKPLSEGEVFVMVLDRTPFYAESGGQIWDEGTLGPLNVLKVLKMGGMVFHFCVYTAEAEACARPGAALKARVDYKRRVKVACNHSGTHLLNFVLREVYDENSYQRGSQLDAEKLKFDIAATKPLSDETLQRIERRLQEIIDADWKVEVRELPFKQAVEIPGIRANFTDVYPETVRVVCMTHDGQTVDGIANAIEICGGTHVPSTGLLKSVIVVGEEGISKGVRRLTLATNEQSENSKAVLASYWEQLAALESQLFKFSEGMDTALMAQQANDNLKRLTALRFQMQSEKLLPLLGKRDLKARFDEMINAQVSAGVPGPAADVPQVDAGKVHQKKLGVVAKSRSAEYVAKFQAGDFGGAKVTRSGAELVRLEADELEGEVKSVNLFTQTLAKALPKVAILVTSRNRDGSCVSCRCIVPAGAPLDAIALANEAAVTLGQQPGGLSGAGVGVYALGRHFNALACLPSAAPSRHRFAAASSAFAATNRVTAARAGGQNSQVVVVDFEEDTGAAALVAESSPLHPVKHLLDFAESPGQLRFLVSVRNTDTHSRFARGALTARSVYGASSGARAGVAGGRRCGHDFGAFGAPNKIVSTIVAPFRCHFSIAIDPYASGRTDGRVAAVHPGSVALLQLRQTGIERVSRFESRKSEDQTRPLSPLDECRDRYLTGKFDPHHRDLFACASGDGFELFDWRQAAESPATVTSGKFHFADVLDLDFNPNVPNELVTAGEDGRVAFWDLRATYRPVDVLEDGHRHCVSYARFNSFHDQLLLTGGPSATLLHQRGAAPPTIHQSAASSRAGCWSASDAWHFAVLSGENMVFEAIPTSVKYKLLI
ncbi:cytosolic tRNA-Ala synthetase [Babesia caballi]|uniref:Alanine--tRNA ligase n=1 Tax=Babesia caballi TaxID=5871 RepID=A0AAV4LVQ9_BABCB|nr:cytosolic tRNA-Ala synthetase [Babesia caballi]